MLDIVQTRSAEAVVRVLWLRSVVAEGVGREILKQVESQFQVYLSCAGERSPEECGTGHRHDLRSSFMGGDSGCCV